MDICVHLMKAFTIKVPSFTSPTLLYFIKGKKCQHVFINIYPESGVTSTIKSELHIILYQKSFQMFVDLLL